MSPEIETLLRPLSARSLVASALLGSHPPALSGRLLVAMAERFGISSGTARVALSRMVERGELVNDAGVYGLGGSLLERQERQDSRRQARFDPWDGTWEQVVVTVSGRSSAVRSRLRGDLVALGLGELREGVWMRPANLDPSRQPSLRAAVADLVVTFTIEPIPDSQGRDLVAELFELDEWAGTATSLGAAIGDARGRLDTDPDAVVSGFSIASATLRHLTHDPQLPYVLEPASWPAADLRAVYQEFEAAYQALLRQFFRTA
ncbi:MAG: PaaX domain-containing protein, C- domain protein [Actinomycetia bacterium]|nr:PaaX domain-containing protein, C- domain protein [Actinomycetes bacterium]